MVAAGPEVDQVLFGADGVLTAGVLPPLVIDCSTVDLDDGAGLRTRAAAAGSSCWLRRCPAMDARSRPAP